MAVISRRIILTGNDTTGWVWTCGTCGNSASQSAPSQDDCLADFDVHYNTAPSVEVDQWLLDALDAAQALATAAATAGVLGQQAAAWTAAVGGGPPDVIATWRNHGITHPQ